MPPNNLMDGARAPIRLAIIGLGKIARDSHLPAIEQSSDFELVASVDPSGSIGRIPNFASLKELLASDIGLDAVSICTPPGPRAAIAGAAIEAGLHVMLEKPPAASVQAATKLVSLASEHEVTLFASWHSREAAGVEAARKWLEARKVESVSVRWHEHIDCWHPGQSWILEKNSFGVLDPGINAFSILTHILPMPLSICDAALFIPKGRASPIRAWIDLALGDAAIGKADLDFLAEGEPIWRIAIATRDGALRLEEGGARLWTDGVPVLLKERDEYAALYARFGRLIANFEIDADLAPLRLAEEVLEMGCRVAAPAFSFECEMASRTA